MTSLLQRFLNVRPNEVAPLVAATFYFFCVLTAGQVLRPARDAIGMSGGLDSVRWLFIGTAIATLAVNPLFSLLVSRFRRLVFIALTYGFFAASLVGFYALIALAPSAVGEVSGRVFYVWFSVFNVFSTMVFWALMADRFTLEQSKRLFGAIAVGGTLGAIAGPALAGALAVPLGTPALLLVSAALLVLSIVSAGLVARLQPDSVPGRSGASSPIDATVIGGSAWDGVRAVFRSRYLLGISTYVLIMTVIATYIYFTRLSMVDALGLSRDAQTAVFARMDLLAQTATLVLQALVFGHLVKRVGVAIALTLLPVVVVLGFVGLAAVGSIGALIALEAGFRATQRAIARPSRETLFTVVSREDKYKAKAFTDTFVYRGGDVVGAWTEGLLGRLGLAFVGLASITVPLAILWAVLGLWLGRRQESMLEPVAPAAEPRAARSGTAGAVTAGLP